MNSFYNPKYAGGVVFLRIEPVEGELNYNKKGNVVKITSEGNVAGYNIFEISEDITTEEKDHTKLTDELMNTSRKYISGVSLDYKLNADLSSKFVVDYVETENKHPSADKLSVLDVNVGNGTLQIVCGTSNVEAGQKIIITKVGTVIPNGMVIKDAGLYGVASSGMICSVRGSNLPNAPKEKDITVLDDNYEAGQAFFE